jgi:hypothetical protein
MFTLGALLLAMLLLLLLLMMFMFGWRGTSASIFSLSWAFLCSCDLAVETLIAGSRMREMIGGTKGEFDFTF